MSEQEAPEQRSAWERHAQTLIGALIAALMLWVGTTVNQLQKDVVALQVQMQTVAAAMTGRYSQADADCDLGEVRRRMEAQGESIREMRGRIDRLERGG